MPVIIDDDWKQRRLDSIHEFILEAGKPRSTRIENLADDIISIFSGPVFLDEDLKHAYVDELNEFLIPMLDLTEEWEKEFIQQWKDNPHKPPVDRRRLFYIIYEILRNDVNVPESVLSRACQCSTEYYRFAAADNPNCPEEDRVYVWLRDNADGSL